MNTDEKEETYDIHKDKHESNIQESGLINLNVLKAQGVMTDASISDNNDEKLEDLEEIENMETIPAQGQIESSRRLNDQIDQLQKDQNF